MLLLLQTIWDLKDLRALSRGAPFCVQVAGSSLALLHIDQRTFKLTMACCGGANAVLGELVHGLAAQVITALSEVAVLR